MDSKTLAKHIKGCAVATATALLGILVAGCGGAETPDTDAQQRAEAAAMRRAVTIARDTNAAKMRGEKPTKNAGPNN